MPHREIHVNKLHGSLRTPEFEMAYNSTPFRPSSAERAAPKIVVNGGDPQAVNHTPAENADNTRVRTGGWAMLEGRMVRGSLVSLNVQVGFRSV